MTRGVAYTHVPIEIGNNEENPIEIELLSGEATGKGVSLKFDRFYRDRIEEWTGSDTGVRWSIDVVQAGIYELVLEYGSDSSDAGSDVLISVGDAKITHTVQATAGRNVFRPNRP